jgi:hypothetical protein
MNHQHLKLLEDLSNASGQSLNALEDCYRVLDSLNEFSQQKSILEARLCKINDLILAAEKDYQLKRKILESHEANFANAQKAFVWFS